MVGDYLFVEKYAYGYSKYSFPLDMAPIDGRIFEKSPKRGDIAVFRQPKRVHIDYIKRIIGLPGDTVQMRGGGLYINGAPVPREYLGIEDLAEGNAINVYQKYVETLPEDRAGRGRRHHIYEISDAEVNDDTEVYTVPDGYYFAMGDNRDSSLDSRVTDQVGLVPAENLVGRAAFIFFSTAGTGEACHREGTLASVRRVGCLLVTWPQVVRYNRLFRAVHDL
jgi:signal peptidase I